MPDAQSFEQQRLDFLYIDEWQSAMFTAFAFYNTQKTIRELEATKGINPTPKNKTAPPKGGVN